MEEIEAQGSQRGRSGVASLLDRPLVHVLRLFTSFGYFDDLAEHVTVVRNIARSLKPGGSVVLDYLNVHHADRHLTPEDVTERDGIVYRLTRWTDAHHIFKRIVIDEGRGRRPLEYTERVARFVVEDFQFMFALCD